MQTGSYDLAADFKAQESLARTLTHRHEYPSYRGTIRPRFQLPIKSLLTFITDRTTR